MKYNMRLASQFEIIGVLNFAHKVASLDTTVWTYVVVKRRGKKQSNSV